MQQQLIKLNQYFHFLEQLFLIWFYGLCRKSLIPFIAALILAYILNPLVDKLENKFKIRRKYSAMILALLVLLTFVSIPMYLIPVLVGQFKVIISKITTDNCFNQCQTS